MSSISFDSLKKPLVCQLCSEVGVGLGLSLTELEEEGLFVITLTFPEEWKPALLAYNRYHDTRTLKNRNKCSQNRNCVASVPIPTFMFLFAIYIFS